MCDGTIAFDILRCLRVSGFSVQVMGLQSKANVLLDGMAYLSLL